MINDFSLPEIAALVLGILALILAGLVWFKIFRLQNFQKKFFAGRKASDLENLILTHDDRLDELADEIKSIVAEQKRFFQIQKLAIQKIGVVRFNAFAAAGGNNSFAVALLDAQNNGIVISSLYGRDSQRVYAKAIKSGESETPLTGEEKQAILESQRVVSSAKNLKTK